MNISVMVEQGALDSDISLANILRMQLFYSKKPMKFFKEVKCHFPDSRCHSETDFTINVPTNVCLSAKYGTDFAAKTLENRR